MPHTSRFLLTGLSGTVAPALADALRARGRSIIPYSGRTDPSGSEREVRAFIERNRPAWVCHVATGPVEWAQWIANACNGLNIPLLWIGSVSVFSEKTPAPIGVDAAPDATDDYGRYKIECERRVLAACPSALIARIGWQIGEAPGSNNMVDYFCKAAAANNGCVEASARWIPSTAFLRDTAESLVTLMDRGAAGVFHLEGNTAGMSMFDLATALNQQQRRGWSVVATETLHRDNRMRDDRVRITQVNAR